jgi:hypothetical protein
MKEKLAEFFKQELTYTRVGLLNETDPIQRSNICWYAMQRGLGATQFAQMCGMRYLDAEPMFEQYKLMLEKERNYEMR